MDAISKFFESQKTHKKLAEVLAEHFKPFTK